MAGANATYKIEKPPYWWLFLFSIIFFIIPNLGINNHRILKLSSKSAFSGWHAFVTMQSHDDRTTPPPTTIFNSICR
jgi:hypothetical protein